MTIIDPKNGGVCMRTIETISEHYDEICFKYYIFKTHQYDWEPSFDNYVKENHGYSSLFKKNINRTNYRFLVLNTLSCNLFFAAGIFQIFFYQKELVLKSSNIIF